MDTQTHMHDDMQGANSELSRSLNNTSSGVKNNVQRQPVDIITRLEPNNKFAHEQTLTDSIVKPYISKQRQPQIPDSHLST